MITEAKTSTRLERAHEADRIICRKNLQNKTAFMSHRDRLFVEEVAQTLDKFGDKADLTPWQLIWLNDLEKRYCNG